MATADPPPEHRLLLANRLRELRAERGWSQQTLASETGLDRAFLAQIELCRKAPTVDTLHRIATSFGVGIGDLFG
jgi:transcriptional regulator with XRE-family HTH domain